MGCVDCKCDSYCLDGAFCYCPVTVLMRNDLQWHVEEKCEHRPYTCEYCGLEGMFIVITNNHYDVCDEFPVRCPNKCSGGKIKRAFLDSHRKICPLEKIDCPFVTEGCEAKELLRKDEAEHLEKNLVNHQLLMLKAQKKREKEREKQREKREKEREDRENDRLKVIAEHLDTLATTSTEEQRLPLQSICSLIDMSYTLNDGGQLTLSMTNFSSYRRPNSVWYSPPFYVGDITGPKLRLAVHANGVGSGARSHVSLVIQSLERDSKKAIDNVMCGACIRVEAVASCAAKGVIMTERCCSVVFCECEQFDKADIQTKYKFIPHKSIGSLCNNDTLTFEVKYYDCVLRNEFCAGICTCFCHDSL